MVWLQYSLPSHFLLPNNATFYLLSDHIHNKNKNLLKFKNPFSPHSETYTKFSITVYPNSAQSA